MTSQKNDHKIIVSKKKVSKNDSVKFVSERKWFKKYEHEKNDPLFTQF